MALIADRQAKGPAFDSGSGREDGRARRACTAGVAWETRRRLTGRP